MVGGRAREGTGGGHSEWEERCQVGRKCFRKAQWRIGYKLGTETLSQKKTGFITCFVIFRFGLGPLSFPPQVIEAAEK